MAAKTCGEEGSGPWDTVMKGKHCLSLGPHTIGNSSVGDWRTIKKGGIQCRIAKPWLMSAMPRSAGKSTELDLMKTKPNKCWLTSPFSPSILKKSSIAIESSHSRTLY